MSTRELANLVHGELRPVSVAGEGHIADPNTGQILSPRPGDDASVVDLAVGAAEALHRAGWSRRAGLEDRAAMLTGFADELESLAEEIAVAEMVSPGLIAAVARPIAGGSADQVRGVVAEMRELGSEATVPASGAGGPVILHRDPWGPVVVMPPWNAPTPTAIGKAAAAMAAGCPVIIKVHERAPLSARVWQEAAMRADIPAGVLQIIHGGPATALGLAEDARVRAIAMTGGAPAGRAIAQAGAAHFARLQLELGGLNPAIVLPDADIAATARALALGSTKLSGQWCEAPGQVFVPPRLHEDLVDALVAELAALRIGASTDEGTDVGPLVDAAHVAAVSSQVAALESSGGQVLRSGAVVADTACGFVPCVVTGVPAEAAFEEIFGPVLSVHTYADLDATIDFVNSRQNGLAGYVFGDNVAEAMSVGARLLGGEIKINGTSLFDLSPESHQSFWGTSGIGGHGQHDSFEFFRGYRIVGVDNPEAPI